MKNKWLDPKIMALILQFNLLISIIIFFTLKFGLLIFDEVPTRQKFVVFRPPSIHIALVDYNINLQVQSFDCVLIYTTNCLSKLRDVQKKGKLYIFERFAMNSKAPSKIVINAQINIIKYTIR